VWGLEGPSVSSGKRTSEDHDRTGVRRGTQAISRGRRAPGSPCRPTVGPHERHVPHRPRSRRGLDASLPPVDPGRSDAARPQGQGTVASHGQGLLPPRRMARRPGDRRGDAGAFVRSPRRGHRSRARSLPGEPLAVRGHHPQGRARGDLLADREDDPQDETRHASPDSSERRRRARDRRRHSRALRLEVRASTGDARQARSSSAITRSRSMASSPASSNARSWRSWPATSSTAACS
jgi:hypothetical protein